MSPVLLQVLFYCLIPVGIFLVIKTIRMLMKSFNGTVITEVPFTQREIVFSIPHTGVYSIWQRGKVYKHTRINNIDLKLTRVSYGEVPVRNSSMSLYVNGFGSGRIEWKKFDADYGNYKLELTERTQSSGGLLGRIFSGGPINYGQFTLQIRESQHSYYLLIGIPLIIISLALIFGGVVLAINAKAVATALGWG